MSQPLKELHDLGTPRCDELAREHNRIMAGTSGAGVVQDWIALAQDLERKLIELARAYADNLIALDERHKRSLSDEQSRRERAEAMLKNIAETIRPRGLEAQAQCIERFLAWTPLPEAPK